VKPWLGVEVSGFTLERGDIDFAAASTGGILIARPFQNVQAGGPSSLLVSSPGVASGGVDVHSTSRLFGTEATLLLNAFRGCKFGVNLLGGFRYLDLQEDLDVTQNTQLLASGVAGFGGTAVGPGTRLAIADAIDAHNQFYGGQVGIQTGLQMGRVFVGTTAKFAIGDTHQVVSANGLTTQLNTGASLPGGLLVLPSNSGRHTNDVFTMLPEGNIEIGYQLTKRVNLSLGYSFLYWLRVARPGDQLSQSVATTQVPSSLTFVPGSTATQPALVLTDRSMWVQGLSAGLSFRY